MGEVRGERRRQSIGRRALGDRRGSVAVTVALAMTVLLGMGAFAVDLADVFTQRTSLQGATDAAALAAVLAPSRASAVAQDSLASNHYASSVLLGSSTGFYCPDRTIAAASRYTAGSTSCVASTTLGTASPAVRLTTLASVPLGFGRVLYSGSSLPVTTTSTAALVDVAAFTAGTGLAAVSTSTSPLLNAVLGGLLHTSVNLTAVQYEGLLGANISTTDFLNALSADATTSVGNYSDLLSSTISVKDIAQAAETALSEEGGSSATVSALGALVSAAPSTAVAIGSLLDLGPYLNDATDGAQPAALSSSLNVYDLVSYAAQIANGSHAITLSNVAVNLPGIASISGSLTAISPPVSVGFGPVGESVSTSQIRLQLTIKLLGTLSLPLLGTPVAVTVPLTVSVARGTATLTGISCTGLPSSAGVTIQAQSGAVAASIGTSAAAPATIAGAMLLGLPVLTVTDYAAANVGGSAATNLSFSAAQIQAQTIQSVSSTAMTSTLLGSVLGSTKNLNVSLLGSLLLLTTPAVVLGSLDPLLALAATGIDPLVNGLLAALGVRLGYMDVTATGVRCNVPVLMQ